MRKLLLLLTTVISITCFGQYQPTGSKVRYVNGIGFGTKSEATLGVQDSLVLFGAADSTLKYKFKGTARALAYSSDLSGYVPYTGATTNLNLGSFKITANKAQLDSLQAKGSGGLGLYSNSGTKVGEFGVGGGSNFDFHGFAGYDANRSSGYTVRSFTDKRYVDSIAALKVNFTDTAAMLSPYYRTATATAALALKLNISDTAAMLSGYKTYYPRAALSAGTGITYNSTTGVITNASPSLGGTVTSVATNNGSGITGGTITGSGTIAADTTVLSTKANVTALLLGKVSSVTGTSPIVSSGGTTPAISIPAATTSVNGYLTSTDWTTFNNKQAAFTQGISGYIPKWTSASGLDTSSIRQVGSSIFTAGRLNVAGATDNASYALNVTGAGLFTGTSSATSLEVLKLTNSGSGANTQAKIQFNAAGTNYGNIAGGYGVSAPQMTYNVNAGGNHLFQGDGVQVVGYLTASSLTNLASRLNVAGATDNSSFQLNVNGAANISANATFGGTVTLSAPTPILQFSNGTTAGLLYQAGTTIRLSDNSGGFPFVYDFSDGSISVNATKSGYAAQINNLSTNGSGLLIVAGNTSSNYPLNVVDKTNTYNYLLIRGDGVISASSLVGTGNRMVVASSTGGLSTQAIPSGGGTDGTYTPTATVISNLGSVTTYPLRYTRIGNVVTVSGLIEPSVTTANTRSSFYITLPVAPTANFSQIYYATGSGSLGGTSASTIDPLIVGEYGGTRVEVNFTAAATGSAPQTISFSYTVAN